MRRGYEGLPFATIHGDRIAPPQAISAFDLMTSAPSTASHDASDASATESATWRVLALAALTAAGIFCFYGNGRSLWLDEAFSVNLALHDWNGIVDGLKADGHPPLYFFLLKVWIYVFGFGEAAARGLSAACFAITLWAIYRLAREAFGHASPALIAALLFLTSKTAVSQAQNVRMYALLACLVALSTLFYYRCFFLGSRRSMDLLGYTLTTLLGTLTHFWYGFTALAQLVGLLWLGERRQWKIYVFTTALSALPFITLWLPILIRFQLDNGVSDWMQGRAFGPRILAATFTDYYGEGWLGGLVWVAILLLILGSQAHRLLPAMPSRERLRSLLEQLKTPPNGLFLLLVFGSLLPPLLISQIRPIYRIGSYTLIALVPLTLVTASFLHRFVHRRHLQLFLLGLLASAITAFIWIRSQPVEHSDRVAARHVLDHSDVGDVILYTSLSRSAIDYYLELLAPQRSFTRRSFPVELDRHPGWRNPREQLAHPAALADEADRLVDELRRTLTPEQRVWLFYGIDRAVSDVLTARLERHFVIVDQLDCPTEFFNSVITYRLKKAPAPPGGEALERPLPPPASIASTTP